MSASTLTALREKTEQLKPIAEALNKQVETSKAELDELNALISRNEIELSLINEAFHMKYGDMSEIQKEQYITAMKQTDEISTLQTNLQREKEQITFLESEVKRQNGILPQTFIEDIDIDALEAQKEDLIQQLKQLKKSNAKGIQGLKATNSKIKILQNNIKKMETQLTEKLQKENEIEQIKLQAEDIQTKNDELANVYKEENKKTKEIQKKLAEASEQLNKLEEFSAEHENDQQISKEIDELSQIYDYISEANKPYEKMKEQNLEFRNSAVDVRKRLSSQIDEFDSLLKSLYQYVK